MSLADRPHENIREVLSESAVAADPFEQFARWLGEALAAQLPEPNAMTVATVTPEGRPSARMVLLRGVDARGFVFYTNYESRKGQELRANSWAALVFYWPELERQVRVEGRVQRVPPAESDTYFAGRAAGSRLGAWASPQSQVIPDRDALESQLEEVAARFAGGAAIPRPPHWGGYRVIPDTIEFWQGRPNRLHDRLRFRREAGGPWHLERLAP